MKVYTSTLICMFCCLSVLLSSCEKDLIDVWNTKARVQFYVQTTNSDLEYIYADKDFSFLMASPDVLFEENGVKCGWLIIPLEVAGLVSDKDRPVNIVVEKDKRNPQTKYEIEPAVIKAGALTGSFRIKLYQTPNLSTQSDTINIAVGVSEDFELGLPEQTHSRILITSGYIQPSWWKNAFWNDEWNYGNWGPFTQEKMAVFVAATGGFEDPYPNYNQPVYLYNAYLINKYIDEHDSREADGTPMAHCYM